MALPLPDGLLNRVNKGLREECERVLAEVRRFQAVARLERETVRAAQVKVATAKERLANVTRMEAQIRFKVSTESELLSQAEVEASKLAQEVQQNRITAKDTLERVDAVAKRAEAARAKLHEAETLSTAMEQDVLNWIEENKITASATGGATALLEARAKRVEDLHREAAQLTTKSRRLEAELADEVSVRDTLLIELQRCRADAAAGQQEILKIQADIVEAQRKAEEERAARRDPRDELEDARRQYVESRRAADEAKAECAVVESAVDSTQSAIYATEAKRSRVTMQLAEAQSALADVEREFRVLQAQCGITANGTSDAVRQIEGLREQRDVAVQRLAKVESKWVALRDAIRMAEDDADALAREDDMYGQLTKAHAADITALESAMDLGMMKMQRIITQHAEACAAASEHNDRVVSLQEAVRRAAQEEKQLRSRLQQMDQTLGAVTDDIAQLTTAIAEEESELREIDSEKRQALKERVEELREELEETERTNIKLRREVDGVQNEVRQAAVIIDAQQATIAELQSMCEAVKAETAALQNDSSKHAALKGDKAAVLERLDVQLEQLRRKVNGGLNTVATAQYERAVAEAEAAQREALLVAEIDAARVEYHSAEAERRSFSLRLQDANQKLGQLQSRHLMMMQSLAAKVNAEIAEAAAAEMAVTKAPVSAAEGALMVSASVVEAMTPEELSARCFLARATEREALMTRGNALDETIVKAEKDSKTLIDAIAMLRHREETGMLVAVDPESEAVDRFIEDIRARYAEGGTVELTQDLYLWTQEAEELSHRLRDAKGANAVAMATLESARQAKARALSELRQAERALQQLTVTATQERLRTERMRDVVRVTQQSVLSDERATNRLYEQREKRHLASAEETLWHIVQRAAHRHAALEAHYRRLAAAFGLNVPTSSSSNPSATAPLQPVSGNYITPPPSARSSSSSLKTATPSPAPFARRPATAALVAAMTERRHQRQVVSAPTTLQVQGRASSASRAGPGSKRL